MALMIQGTASDVGKSLLVTALCRIFAQDGLRVAPFKAQNMALNSAVTADGGEIGRAQYVQAQAAKVEPAVAMNPILLKPLTDTTAQVILLGRAHGNFSAKEYIAFKRQAADVVRHALNELKRAYDLVVIEGAGSPAEINLREHDLVNMTVAAMAEAPVLLAADIDRGGIFAYVLGTLGLLDPAERDRVKGIIVNKFRGEAARFAEGRRLLAERSGLPVVGVVPFLTGLRIPEEDTVPANRCAGRGAGDADKLRIGVLYLPHISNFTDFDPLAAEDAVALEYIKPPQTLAGLDLAIVPGSKNTLGDLRLLRAYGYDRQLKELAAAGVPVFGVCGGFQMLGRGIMDPDGTESDLGELEGIGLLDVETVFGADKTVTRASGRILADGPGLFQGCRGLDVDGYEIHHGRTARAAGQPLLELRRRGGQTVPDGCVSADGRVAGTYLHGIFDADAFRARFLQNLKAMTENRRGNGSVSGQFGHPGPTLDQSFDLLAAQVRASLDMTEIYRIIGLPVAGA